MIFNSTKKETIPRSKSVLGMVELFGPCKFYYHKQHSLSILKWLVGKRSHSTLTIALYINFKKFQLLKLASKSKWPPSV
jgi:hypothetical protein